jgi:hypothetical protein
MNLRLWKTCILGVFDESLAGLVRAVLLQVNNCAVGSGERVGSENLLAEALGSTANNQIGVIFDVMFQLPRDCTLLVLPSSNHAK